MNRITIDGVFISEVMFNQIINKEISLSKFSIHERKHYWILFFFLSQRTQNKKSILRLSKVNINQFHYFSDTPRIYAKIHYIIIMRIIHMQTKTMWNIHVLTFSENTLIRIHLSCAFRQIRRTINTPQPAKYFTSDKLSGSDITLNFSAASAATAGHSWNLATVARGNGDSLWLPYKMFSHTKLRFRIAVLALVI